MRNPNSRTFDPSRPVQTRDGSPARILTMDADHPYHPIIALIRDARGWELPEQYTAKGRLRLSGDEDDMDLLNVPEE